MKWIEDLQQLNIPSLLDNLLEPENLLEQFERASNNTIIYLIKQAT